MTLFLSFVFYIFSSLLSYLYFYFYFYDNSQTRRDVVYLISPTQKYGNSPESVRDYEINFDVSEFASGIYFIQIRNEKFEIRNPVRFVKN